MYRVGRSVVSAITHTPASGPFAPVTTPPMSSLSIATAVCAPSCAGAAASSAATLIAATVKYSLALSLMGALLVHFLHGARGPMRGSGRGRGDAILHSPCRPGNKAPRHSHPLAASVTERDAVSRRCCRQGRHCGQDLERSSKSVVETQRTEGAHPR